MGVGVSSSSLIETIPIKGGGGGREPEHQEKTPDDELQKMPNATVNLKN